MVIVVTSSLLLFQYENATKPSSRSSSDEASYMGFIALSFSLLFDGLTGPRQDRVVAKYKLVTGDLMILINLFAAPICLMASLLIEGKKPYLQAASNLSSFLPCIIAFVVCGAIGQIFICQILRELGSLYLTLITTTRKFFAILISIAWFHSTLYLF